MTHNTSKIAQARAEILARIAKSANVANRPAEAITLVAVSKQQTVARIDSMVATGQRVFGENRVQEAQTHWLERRKTLQDMQLHLIGPLQTNKAMEAVRCFDVIETLDRTKLAVALVSAMEKTGRNPDIFVQVNTGEEPQKAGILPAGVDDFIANLRKNYAIEPKGLMCIPPAQEEPAMHFALLQKMAKRNGLNGLSMGMSHDFETAIAFGATHVRIGTALFGARIPR